MEEHFFFILGMLSLYIHHCQQDHSAVQNAVEYNNKVFAHDAVQHQAQIAEDGEEERDWNLIHSPVVAL